MERHLTAELDPAGHVCVCVPAEWLWELVEFLSIQRLATHYEYSTSHYFTVTFPNQDQASVQRALDDSDQSHDYQDQAAHLA